MGVSKKNWLGHVPCVNYADFNNIVLKQKDYYLEIIILICKLNIQRPNLQGQNHETHYNGTGSVKKSCKLLLCLPLVKNSIYSLNILICANIDLLYMFFLRAKNTCMWKFQM